MESESSQTGSWRRLGTTSPEEVDFISSTPAFLESLESTLRGSLLLDVVLGTILDSIKYRIDTRLIEPALKMFGHEGRLKRWTAFF